MAERRVKRDLSEAQFRAALEKQGWKFDSMYSLMAYVKSPQGPYISALNGGTRKRDQLAYLIHEAKLVAAKYGKSE